jgi:predicted Rossmann fold nucleotide-binding protein DprA/Smf involved in DNA uptake
MNANQLLAYISIQHNGCWEDVVKDIKDKVAYDDKDIALVDASKCLTIVNNAYPDTLKEMRCPPVVVWYEGDIELLTKSDCITAVVMPKNPTKYEMKVYNRIIKTQNEGNMPYAIIKQNCIEICECDKTLTISHQPNPNAEGLEYLSKMFGSICKNMIVVGARKHDPCALYAIKSALTAGNDVCVVPHNLDANDCCDEMLAQGVPSFLF